MRSHLCNLKDNVNPRDTVASSPTSPDDSSATAQASAAKRGPVGEFLDHLMSELRQLAHRCAQLELLLHDLAIRHATAGSDPLTANDPPARSKEHEARPGATDPGYRRRRTPTPTENASELSSGVMPSTP